MLSHRLNILFNLIIVFGITVSFNSRLDAQNHCDADSIPLIWDNNSWSQGALSHQIRLGRAGVDDSTDVTVSISTMATGLFFGFDVESPYVDGGEGSAWNFGSGNDLGIIFTPESYQGTSLVEVDVRFSKPVTCLEFDISDIDAWGTTRKDSLIVFGNGDIFYPSIYVVSDTPTVRAFENRAVARGGITGPSGNGSAYSQSDAGTVHVDFGMNHIDSFKILYFEAAGTSEPGSRGIGILGNFSFTEASILPVDLIDFYVEKNEDCNPVLFWETANEYGLENYLVEYSYDGYNFQEVGKIKPKNVYSELNTYSYTVQRKLNAYNFLRIYKVEVSGKKQHLATTSLDGSGCQNLASINVFPNPARRDNFYIEIESKNSQPLNILVVDQFGKQVMKTVYDVTVGKNWFTINSKYLVPGVYHIHFNLGGEKVTRKISIMG